MGRTKAGELVVIAGEERGARHHATALADELHQAELRLTELSARRASIRERLEIEAPVPPDLRALIADCRLVD